MRKILAILAGVCLILWGHAGGAMASGGKRAASVEVRIDISSQSMAVNVNGLPYGRWRVSTAREGYHTPRGSWRPYMTKKMHYSRKYDNSPMPHSVFFLGGYAIHGTNYTRYLGKPASHGCIRLHPRHAQRLYSLVNRHGLKNTRIIITQ